MFYNKNKKTIYFKLNLIVFYPYNTSFSYLHFFIELNCLFQNKRIDKHWNYTLNPGQDNLIQDPPGLIMMLSSLSIPYSTKVTCGFREMHTFDTELSPSKIMHQTLVNK